MKDLGASAVVGVFILEDHTMTLFKRYHFPEENFSLDPQILCETHTGSRYLIIVKYSSLPGSIDGRPTSMESFRFAWNRLRISAGGENKHTFSSYDSPVLETLSSHSQELSLEAADLHGYL